MNEIMEGQACLFDPVIASGRMCQEPSPQTKEKTSKRSSRSSQGSGSRTLPMCLCLRRENGPKPGVSTMNWGGGPLPIGFTTLNIGECRSGGNGFVFWPTSTGSPLRNCCLTLNIGETPRIPNPTKLSQILAEADEKYQLSAKACQGILNRAARRGKELPQELKAALEAQIRRLTEQSASRETELTEQTPQDVTAPAGDGGCYTLNTIDRPAVCTDESRIPHGGVTETVRAEPHGAYPMVAAFSFGQSEKARSLGYEEEKSPTIRGGEGGNQKPVVLACDLYNQSIDGQTAASVTAAVGGGEYQRTETAGICPEPER